MSKYPTFTIESSGDEYRIVQGAVERRTSGSRLWEGVSMQKLLAFEVDSPLWNFLRDYGIARPSPSGRISEAERPTVQVKVRISGEAALWLDAITEDRGLTKSRLIEMWIMQAAEGHHEHKMQRRTRTQEELDAAMKELRAERAWEAAEDTERGRRPPR